VVVVGIERKRDEGPICIDLARQGGECVFLPLT
jgi:hypothetical protein